MSDFWYGILTGCISLSVIAILYGDGQQKQCEQDNTGKKCELLWVPTIKK